MAITALAIAICHHAAAVPLNTAGVSVSSQELAIAQSMASSSGQNRPSLKLDPTLCEVARARAKDMASRHYFSHVNPDGHGPNYMVKAAGYPLPDWWGNDPQANYIESIAAGYSSPSAAWSAWMDSPPHKTHLLAEDSFYSDQTALGVGYYYSSGSDYQSYWVVITAPPRPGSPLTIKAPSNNARVTSADVTATGTASSESNATSIEYALQNDSGTTSYKRASGITNWQAAISNLQPGDNYLLVRSRNSSGTIVAEAKRKIHYAVMRVLTVDTAGSGDVSAGFVGASSREVGKTYTIKASARKGYKFAGWSGSTSSTSSTLHFTMEEGFSLTATFVANPFIAVKNTYTGLIQTSVGAGFVKIKSLGSGKFIGKLTLDGKARTFNGAFALDGSAQVSVPTTHGGSLTFSLNMDLTGGTNQITGSVSDGSSSATIALDGKSYDLKNPAPQTGTYAVTLPSSAGDGSAVIKVSDSGKAVINGTLGDGTKFQAISYVTDDGELTIFAPLYKKTGYLAGTLTFATLSNSDVSGTLTWHHDATDSTSEMDVTIAASGTLQ